MRGFRKMGKRGIGVNNVKRRIRIAKRRERRVDVKHSSLEQFLAQADERIIHIRADQVAGRRVFHKKTQQPPKPATEIQNPGVFIKNHAPFSGFFMHGKIKASHLAQSRLTSRTHHADLQRRIRKARQLRPSRPGTLCRIANQLYPFMFLKRAACGIDFSIQRSAMRIFFNAF